MQQTMVVNEIKRNAFFRSMKMDLVILCLSICLKCDRQSVLWQFQWQVSSGILIDVLIRNCFLVRNATSCY